MVGCFATIVLFGILSIQDVADRDLCFVGIGIVSSLILFIFAVRFDKRSTEKLFIILDDDMRSILRLLELEKTFDQLEREYNGASSLVDDLNTLKKMKLVKENERFRGTLLEKSYIRNL